MQVNVDVKINIMNWDGTITSGDNNDTKEERQNSGSNREDFSENSRETTDSSSK